MLKNTLPKSLILCLLASLSYTSQASESQRPGDLVFRFSVPHGAVDLGRGLDVQVVVSPRPPESTAESTAESAGSQKNRKRKIKPSSTPKPKVPRLSHQEVFTQFELLARSYLDGKSHKRPKTPRNYNKDPNQEHDKLLLFHTQYYELRMNLRDLKNKLASRSLTIQAQSGLLYNIFANTKKLYLLALKYQRRSHSHDHTVIIQDLTKYFYGLLEDYLIYDFSNIESALSSQQARKEQEKLELGSFVLNNPELKRVLSKKDYAYYSFMKDIKELIYTMRTSHGAQKERNLSKSLSLYLQATRITLTASYKAGDQYFLDLGQHLNTLSQHLRLKQVLDPRALAPQGKNKIFYLNETTFPAHPGIKGLEHPLRLAPHTGPRRPLESFLRPRFPKTVAIQGIESGPFSLGEELRLRTKITRTLPECSIDDIFDALHTPRLRRHRGLHYMTLKSSHRRTGKPTHIKIEDCPIGLGTLESVLTNASLIETLVENLSPIRAREDATRNFLLIRPPGHHACSCISGFCYLNNVLWGLRLLQQKHPGELFGVIDVDLHDADGTIEGLRANSRNTFLLNVFDKDEFPYRHTAYRPEDRSDLGFLLDEPLAMHTKKAQYLEALTRGIAKLRAKFSKEPFAIFVSAGFDTSAKDSKDSFGGRGFELQETDYQEIYQRISRAFPQSHVVCMLEGGYDPRTLQESFTHAMTGLFDLPRASAGSVRSHAFSQEAHPQAQSLDAREEESAKGAQDEDPLEVLNLYKASYGFPGGLYNCPAEKCTKPSRSSWNDLKKHWRKYHSHLTLISAPRSKPRGRRK